MRYLLLLYTSEAEWERCTEAEMAAVLREHGELTRDLEETGRYRGSNALEPTAAATTLRVRSGKTLVADGPFAETKEQLLGYYLIDARDLDDAMAIAARTPDAKRGAVEIRPVR